jgi:hypothetical protein
MPSKKAFDSKNYPWKSTINYQQQPEFYRVGKGEQGVLICEPYKSAIVAHWRFKTPDEASKSSETIYAMFLDYLKDNDFVGADMARKFLQMGFTRARRYANYKGGKKYKNNSSETYEKGSGDPQKIISAKIFYEKWQNAESNSQYQSLKKFWKEKYG